MNFHRIAQLGSAAAVASVAACHGPPESEAPGPAVVALAGNRAANGMPGSGLVAPISDPVSDGTPVTERPHKGGVIGVGIRPSRGASGIVP